jgi:hypothetical protein
MYQQCYFLNEKVNTTGQEQKPVEIATTVKQNSYRVYQKIKEIILLKQFFYFVVVATLGYVIP